MSSCGNLLESGGSACKKPTPSALTESALKKATIHITYLQASILVANTETGQQFLQSPAHTSGQLTRALPLSEPSPVLCKLAKHDFQEEKKVRLRNCCSFQTQNVSTLNTGLKDRMLQTTHHLENEAVLPSYHRSHEHAIQFLIILLRLSRSHVSQFPLQVCGTSDS